MFSQNSIGLTSSLEQVTIRVPPPIGAAPPASSPTGAPPASSNQRPNVTLVSPVPGQRYYFGDSINISASAFDPEDGFLNTSQIFLFLDREFQGNLASGNVTLPASDISVGYHTFGIYAVDSEGLQSELVETDVNVLLVVPEQCQTDELSQSSDHFIVDFSQPLENDDEERIFSGNLSLDVQQYDTG